MSSGASVSALLCLVEQLKLEAGVERIKVSQAAAELQQYHAECLQGCPAGGRSSWKQSLSGVQVLCFTLKTVEKKLAEECFQAQTDECLPPNLKKTLL